MARQVDGPLGLVVHPKRDIDRALAGIREWADREGLQVGQVAVDGNDRRVADPIAGEDCAVIVAVGGEGTALAALHAGADAHKPVLGVACGSIGALTAVHANEVEDALDLMKAGDWTQRELPALKVNGKRFAINDLAVVRDGDGQLVTSISIDGDLYASVAGDGVIVSTPLGSSAYTMAAGGPLLTTDCANFVVTPIASPGGSIPPLVADERNELSLDLQAGYGGVRLEVDGRGVMTGPKKLTITLQLAYATLVSLDGGERMISGLRARGLVVDSPRAKMREEREARPA